jgi:hypothetical protein
VERKRLLAMVALIIIGILPLTGAEHGFTKATDKLVLPSGEEREQMTLDFFIGKLVQTR